MPTFVVELLYTLSRLCGLGGSVFRVLAQGEASGRTRDVVAGVHG